MQYIKWFEELGKKDVPLVGGKNASLGEMISTLKSKSIRVPEGFATTSTAYFEFLRENQIDAFIQENIADYKSGKKTLPETGEAIRTAFLNGRISPILREEICQAYSLLSKRYNQSNIDVAVRSSATAEDLPEASFAGQQETFLHITGEKGLLDACIACFASLFTDRAISYRDEKGFGHLDIALSIGIQKMVRSDKGSSGVIFTLDPESGFRDVVVINAGWGLGENIVQGTITPDEYMIFKPLLKNTSCSPIINKILGEKEKKMVYTTFGKKKVKNKSTSHTERTSFALSDDEILKLATWSCEIETHYGTAMDLEWAIDGKTNEIFILQARPETIHSIKKSNAFKSYHIKQKGKVLLEGLAIGDAIATGKAQVIKNVSEIERFIEGSILVTKMTSPDWVPIMKKASGIITNHGGRTSHAAIVSRELGVPAIVGTNNGTHMLKDDQEITLSCAEGDVGYIYEGTLEYEEKVLSTENLPETQTDIMLNIASPAAAFRTHPLPCKGIGLARMEFIINNIIQIHPMALVHFDKITDRKTKQKISNLTRGYSQKTDYFIDKLSWGIARIAASHYPHPTIVRLSDFKTNEYANLIGGETFEPKEENPMLGFRGACRYYNDRYRAGFALECSALKKARETLGLSNILIMIPFCRTIEEADKVLKVMEEHGLKRGENGLEIYVMAEVPSNIILADAFAKRFDGFSIGSNDLTQLLLGVDRDSEELAPLFDERNDAVKKMISSLIEAAHKHGCKVGICGEAPSNYPDFAEFLVSQKIDSISLSPERFISTVMQISQLEKMPKAI